MFGGLDELIVFVIIVLVMFGGLNELIVFVIIVFVMFGGLDEFVILGGLIDFVGFWTHLLSQSRLKFVR